MTGKRTLMTDSTSKPFTRSPYIAASAARRRYRNLTIAGLAALAIIISILTPTGPASAHGGDSHVAIAGSPDGPDSGFGELAIKTPNLTPDQFLKWDKARTDGAVPALQTPGHVPPRRDPGAKVIAPGRGPGSKVIAPGSKTAYSSFGEANQLGQQAQLGAGSVLVGNAGGLGAGSDCFVNFDEKSVLNILPHHAQATFVEWPHWLKECAGNQGNIAIEPKDINHYHLGYEDLQISFCTDIGNFGRHTEPRPVNPTDDELLDWYYTPCTEIDPVAETRSAIQPHGPGYTTSIFAYESFGGKLPMTLDSIQIVSGTSEICWLPAGEWVVGQGGGSPWQCMELGTGYWNMSGIADNVMEVRVTAVTANNVIDNVAADIL